ncbi:MAG: hypothetical protein P8Y85_09780, partial [Nitrospirota bacterium]
MPKGKMRRAGGFHVASEEEVLRGHVTDVYFERSLEILKARKLNPLVKAEFIAKGFPGGWPWGVIS